MDVQKLAKVLAMAASDNDVEALHALRTADRLLNNAGLDFVALAERLSASGPVISATRMEDLEDTVFDLRNEVRHLRSENERLRQPGVAAPNLACAAQDVAQAIRLQAELDGLRAELVKGKADELALRGDFAQAIAVAERLTRQFEQMKGRNDRLEAENRRLSLVAGALKAELDERLADRNHPLPTPTQRPDTIARPEPMARVEPSAPRRVAPSPALAIRGGKPAPVGQYALF
ncbi:MAG: metalloendopeptidase [Phaeospirillum sp.]|nr:metalloendopeptidase [Phaeospirillum sp.]